MGQDSGVPIWGAVERWTPRELWQRYREIAGHDIPLIVLSKMDPLQAEAQRLREKIGLILVDLLDRGELIASGIALPLSQTSRRWDIPPELWPLLTFTHDFQGVVGKGLEYDRVLIREARPATPSPMEGKREALPLPPARPGRPSIMQDIAAEMCRRAQSGQLAPSMRQEAKVLASWATDNFHSDLVPKAKSIERQLGPTYRELSCDK